MLAELGRRSCARLGIEFEVKSPTSRLAFLLPDMSGGGAERVALTLIKHFVETGRSVDLLLMNAEGVLLPLLPPSVRVIDLEARRVRNAIWGVSEYLRRERPAALQASMWPLTIAAILAHRFAGSNARLIVSDHAALSKHYQQSSFFQRSFLRWSVRLLYPLAGARVVVSAHAADDLADLSGLRRSAFEVIYNPVELPGPDTETADIDKLWSGNGYRILTAGRLIAQKNQKLLLDAFARLSARYDAVLMILGEGPLRIELEQHVVELGIADRVAMPGFRLDPTSIYRSADLFVLSSDYEGYPLVLIEALRCGLPVVSTDCLSGPAEILDHGKFGRLTPCGDSKSLAEAMLQELQSPTDPDRLKERAEALSGKHTADRYLELMTGGEMPTASSKTAVG
jgi:glycosyltransferase involved in cell wall biosynthesis